MNATALFPLLLLLPCGLMVLLGHGHGMHEHHAKPAPSDEGADAEKRA